MATDPNCRVTYRCMTSFQRSNDVIAPDAHTAAIDVGSFEIITQREKNINYHYHPSVPDFIERTNFVCLRHNFFLYLTVVHLKNR